MTKTYKISGMTCGGCRSHVEKVLNRIPEVSEATVNLERAEAVIASEKEIPLQVWKKLLARTMGTGFQKNNIFRHFQSFGRSENNPFPADFGLNKKI